MAIKIWDWNDFKGGLSDNPYLWPKGSFQNGSKQVDVESEPNGFKLVSGTTSFSTTGSPDLQFFHAGKHYVFCGDKSAYIDGVLTLAYNSTPSGIMGIIYGVNVLGWYLYLIGSAGIHKASLDLSSITYNVATPATYAGKKPSVVYGSTIYFVNGNVFYSLDSSDVLTAKFTANANNVFVGITFFQDQFRIYSTYSTYSGKYFLLSVTDLTSPQYVVDFPNLPILSATNNRGNDYVIAGFGNGYNDLYVVNGTQSQALKTNMEGNLRLRLFNGVISTRFDDVFIWGSSDSVNSVGTVYKFGKQYAGFQSILTDVFDTTGTIVSIESGLYTYIGVKNGSSYSVHKFEHASPPSAQYYASSGEIQSLVMDFGNPYDKKSLLQLDLAYDCDNSYLPVPHGGTITLYARKDGSDAWTTITTRTPASGIGNLRVVSGELSALGFGDFYKVEFKIKIEPKLNAGNNYYTPLIKWLKAIYEDNINA